MTPGPSTVTVITPTTGRASLARLIASIDAEDRDSRITHLIFWDDRREPGAPDPGSFDSPGRRSLVLPDGFGRFGEAPGSAMRALGLLLATTEWVTFADDDVHWSAGHLDAILAAAHGRHWATTLRRVWASENELIGTDRFESVGDDPGRKVPYEMCDNNCMLFRRELGVAAAPLYRETRAYDDDRLMYGFLKRHAGPRGATGAATVNQVCPERLIPFFRAYCTREPARPDDLRVGTLSSLCKLPGLT